ncbi:MAG: hypothetical protein NWS71_10535 [Opitutales bacterium]|nr:hypothetical protein [Opitutales bacterium]
MELNADGDMPEDSFPVDIRYMSKDGEVQLRIGTRRPSIAQTLPNSQILELYNWIPVPPGAPEGTKPIKNVLANIPLRKAKKQFVIVANSKTNAEFPLTGFSVVDMDEEHLPGQARILNLSNYNVAMAMEKNRVIAKSKTTDSIVEFAPGMTDILIAIEVNQNGNWMQVEGNKLRLSDKVKMYTIVYNHPPSEDFPAPVRVSMFTERVIVTPN